MILSNALTISKRQQTKVNYGLFSLLRDASMACLVLWLTSPYQAFFNNWYIYGFLWIIWIVFAFLSDSKSFIKTYKTKYVFIIFLWPCCMALLSLADWAAFSFYQFTIPFLLTSFAYYANGNHYKSLAFLLFCYFAYFVCIYVNSVRQLRINPNISRILANSDKKITIDYAGVFMANFSFINNLSFLGIFLVFAFKTAKKRILKLILIIPTALCAYLLILAQYTIALLIFLVFSLFILFFFSNRQRKNNKALVAVAVLLLLLPFFGLILQEIVNIIPSGFVERRLRSISELLTFQQIDSNSDLANRASLYWLSVETFFKNFLFGVGGKEFGANGIVGAHSEILDNYAYYGVLFGTIFIFYLISVYKNNASSFDGNFKRAYRLIFIAYFVQCLFNTSYNEEMLFVVFFISPSLIFLLQSYLKNKNYHVTEI